MINIAVCDDDSIQIEIVSNYIKEWSNHSGVKVKIDTFKSGEAFMFEYTEEKSYNIIFLDIDMKKVSGIELSKYIREKDSNIEIVFITGMIKYALHGYRVKALQYLVKPLKEKDIHECLTETYEKLKSPLSINNNYITIELPKKNIRINYEDIIYCIMFSPYIDIYLKDEKITIRKKISDIEEILPKDSFIRCHRSYLVNIKHIKTVSRNYVNLENNIQIPISRGSYKKVNDAFLNYFWEKSR